MRSDPAARDAGQSPTLFLPIMTRCETLILHDKVSAALSLFCTQYGTVPMVSTTGGLVDTVKDGVTGIHMGAMDPDDVVSKPASMLWKHFSEVQRFVHV